MLEGIPSGLIAYHLDSDCLIDVSCFGSCCFRMIFFNIIFYMPRCKYFAISQRICAGSVRKIWRILVKFLLIRRDAIKEPVEFPMSEKVV